MATSHGVEMQCAQECSKAACGAFYVQVKLFLNPQVGRLVKRLNKDSSVRSLKTHQFGAVPCELIVPLLKADGLTCSLVPEDSALGYKDVTNLDTADFNYFYKMDT